MRAALADMLGYETMDYSLFVNDRGEIVANSTICSYLTNARKKDTPWYGDVVWDGSLLVVGGFILQTLTASGKVPPGLENLVRTVAATIPFGHILKLAFDNEKTTKEGEKPAYPWYVWPLVYVVVRAIYEYLKRPRPNTDRQKVSAKEAALRYDEERLPRSLLSTCHGVEGDSTAQFRHHIIEIAARHRLRPLFRHFFTRDGAVRRKEDICRMLCHVPLVSSMI